eukprot:c21956_g1_i1 orf=240-2300(+)
MSEISRLGNMDRENTYGRLQGRYALIRQHPVLTIAFVLLIAPPVSKAISLFSPLLISIALCFIALVILGPQLERIGAGEKINLERKMKRKTMPNLDWKNNVATNDEKSMKGYKDLQKSKEIALMRGRRKLRRTSMANRSDCSLGGREPVCYEKGKITEDLDEDGLNVDSSRKDGGIVRVKKNSCHKNVLNMSEGEGCIIIGSVGLLLARTVTQFQRSNYSDKTIQLNNDRSSNVDTNDVAPSFLSAERYTFIPKLQARTSESDAEPVFLMTSSQDVTACNRRVELKIVPKFNVKEAIGDQVKGPSDVDGTVDKHQIHPQELLHEEAVCLEGHKIEEEIQSVSKDINKKFIWGSEDSLKIDEDFPIVSPDPYILEKDVSWQENSVEKLEKVKPNPPTLNQRVHEDDSSSNNFSMSAKLDHGTDSSQVTFTLDPAFQDVSVPSFSFASRKQFPVKKSADYTLTAKEEDYGGKDKNAIKGRNSDKDSEFRLFQSATMDLTDSNISMKQNTDNHSNTRPLQNSTVDGTELVSVLANPGVSDPNSEMTNRNHLPHSRDCQSIIIVSRPDTLIREQEMDLLWQEYDQKSRRNTNATAEEKENPETEGEDVHQATSPTSVYWAQSAEAMQAYADQDQDYQREGAELQKGHNTLRRGCWQFRGRRSIRRSLLCFSRALKRFGLTQCIQSSKVNN